MFRSISVPNPQNTIELHPAASPSRPSVKFTELLKAIIVIIDIGTMKLLKLIVKSFKRIRLLLIKLFLNRKSTKNVETNTWSINFSLLLSPKFIWFFMLKKSSRKPIKKKPNIVIKNANLNLNEIILTLDIIKKKKGIIKIPPMVGVLLLLKCKLGPSVLIVCKRFNFWINLIPYFVEIADAVNDKIYKKKIYVLFMDIEFIKVINEIIVIKTL